MTRWTAGGGGGGWERVRRKRREGGGLNFISFCPCWPSVSVGGGLMPFINSPLTNSVFKGVVVLGGRGWGDVCPRLFVQGVPVLSPSPS